MPFPSGFSPPTPSNEPRGKPVYETQSWVSRSTRTLAPLTLVPRNGPDKIIAQIYKERVMKRGSGSGA